MVRKAVCCCGASFVEIDGDPALNAICHCDNCKRRTGTAFGWSVYFADDQIVGRHGHFREYSLRGNNPQQRWFCATCGTTLFWKAASFPRHTGIAGGCFIEPPLPEPTVTVSNDERHEWVGLPTNWRTSL